MTARVAKFDILSNTGCDISNTGCDITVKQPAEPKQWHKPVIIKQCQDQAVFDVSGASYRDSPVFEYADSAHEIKQNSHGSSLMSDSTASYRDSDVHSTHVYARTVDTHTTEHTHALTTDICFTGKSGVIVSAILDTGCKSHLFTEEFIDFLPCKSAGEVILSTAHGPSSQLPAHFASPFLFFSIDNSCARGTSIRQEITMMGGINKSMFAVGKMIRKEGFNLHI